MQLASLHKKVVTYYIKVVTKALEFSNLSRNKELKWFQKQLSIVWQTGKCLFKILCLRLSLCYVQNNNVVM